MADDRARCVALASCGADAVEERADRVAAAQRRLAADLEHAVELRTARRSRRSGRSRRSARTPRPSRGSLRARPAPTCSTSSNATAGRDSERLAADRGAEHVVEVALSAGTGSGESYTSTRGRAPGSCGRDRQRGARTSTCWSVSNASTTSSNVDAVAAAIGVGRRAPGRERRGGSRRGRRRCRHQAARVRDGRPWPPHP